MLDVHTKIAQRQAKAPCQHVVISMVLEIVDTDMETLLQRSRKRVLVEKRQFMMYALKSIAKLSYQNIGDSLNMNHATVIHGVRNVKQLNDVGVQPISNWIDQLNKRKEGLVA